MIDYGLLVSVMIAFGVPSLVGSRWPVTGRGGRVGFVDVALGPAFTGVIVGRIATLAFDDPNSMGSLSDMLIIRSGVEFWPGVAAAAGAVLLSAHLGLVPLGRRLSELVPLGMLGYAGYEAACVFRDGCFGPESPVGLRPPGLSATMLPIGWLMAASVALAAVGVHRLVARGRSPLVVVLAATGAVALVRGVGSIWLPHVGEGVTRQHLSSLAVALATLAIALVLLLVTRNRAEAQAIG